MLKGMYETFLVCSVKREIIILAVVHILPIWCKCLAQLSATANFEWGPIEVAFC